MHADGILSLATSKPTPNIACNASGYLILSCFYHGVNSILSIWDVSTGNVEELWGCWNWFEVWKGINQSELLWQFDFRNVKIIVVLLIMRHYIQIFISKEVQLSFFGLWIVNLNFLINESLWLLRIGIEHLIKNVVEFDFFAVHFIIAIHLLLVRNRLYLNLPSCSLIG